jgi:Ca2+-binding RTX toxin-like protein
MFQPLERRLLLTQLIVAGTPFDDAVRISLAGNTPGGPDIRIANEGTRPITVKVDGNAVTLAAMKTIRTEQIKRGGVTAISSIDLGGGDDYFFGNPALNVRMTVSGGSGNDRLYTGSFNDLVDGGEGDDEIGGGKGRDTLLGGVGGDTLDGGTGNDRLEAAGGATASLTPVQGEDFLFGGIGDDVLVGPPRVLVGVNTRLEGGEGNDSLSAGPSDDFLVGGDGDDTLRGNDGGDVLIGGRGSDLLAGGGGNDEYNYRDETTSPETDLLTELPGGGTDLISVAGPRFAFGSLADGAIAVNLSDPVNLFRQGPRRARIVVGQQNNLENVRGGNGRDTLIGNDADNELISGDDLGEPDDKGFRFFRVDPAADFVSGGRGNDTLGGNGRDTLDGGEGNDTYRTVELESVLTNVVAGPGDDSQIGFVDANVATYALKPDVKNASLSATTLSNANPSGIHVVGNGLDNLIELRPFVGRGFKAVAAFTLISGGAGNDTIRAVGDDDEQFRADLSPIRQTYEGNAGDDLLVGNQYSTAINAEVLLRGGSGRDTLQASNGTVWADYSDRGSPVFVDLSTGRFVGRNGDVDLFGPGVVNVRGSFLNDTLVGDAGDNILDGYFGADDLRGGAGDDTSTYANRAAAVRAGLGPLNAWTQTGERDVTSGIETLVGSQYDDTLIGSDAADVIYGLRGDDLVEAGGGNDRVSGGLEADDLRGGAGDDTLEGNQRGETLLGGAGNDLLDSQNESLPQPLVANDADFDLRNLEAPKRSASTAATGTTRCSAPAKPTAPSWACGRRPDRFHRAVRTAAWRRRG